jgi:hypothetical protein
VFENRVLRRIFGSENEIIRDWRELHNEKHLYFLLLAKYNLNDQVKEVRMDREFSMYVREEKLMQWFSVRKPEGKRPLGRWRLNMGFGEQDGRCGLYSSDSG